MWREECLWNVTVLQRVRLSNLVHVLPERALFVKLAVTYLECFVREGTAYLGFGELIAVSISLTASLPSCQTH
jgi:hypothetical protein